MKGLTSSIQFPSHFELCHQCFLIGDANGPPYLSKPYQVVLEKLQIAFALAVTQQSILEFLHLSHPERNINKYKNILIVKCKEAFFQQKYNVFFMA